MGLFDEGEGYRGIQERMEEEKDTVEEYCSNLRNQIKKLKEEKSVLVDTLASLQSIVKDPGHRTQRTLLQTCHFFDELILPIIEQALAQVKGDQS